MHSSDAYSKQPPVNKREPLPNKLQTEHTHPRLTALFPGLPGWAGTRKVTPIWILLKQETVSGSGISWAICKSAPSSRQITTPAPHHSIFLQPDALPAAQPTASKHWRQEAADRKSLKYAELSAAYDFSPVAAETHGPMDKATISLSLSCAVKSQNTWATRLTVVTFSSKSACSYNTVV